LRILLTADAELPVPPRLYGGIERILDALVRAYVARGHEVGLVAHRDSTSPASRLYPWATDSSLGLANARANTPVLRRAVRDFRPDVIHSHSRLLWLLGLVADPTPKVMSYQREPTGRTIRWSRRLHGGRLVFTGISDYIAKAGRERGGGDWTTVPNFVDTGLYTFRATVPDDAPLVFLSRIEAIKGCHTAIEIAKRAGRRLLIAGNHVEEGEAGAYWRERILPELGKHGIEHVGPVDDAQKDALLGQAAAMVVPIEWNEPFGIVFAESLACGTPVIACPRGALPEIVEEGRHGFLIRSVEEGVAAVARLGEIDRAECRARVEERFSAEVVAGQFLDLYGRLAASRRP
jgi:glycosyltransferase involved in cell wall biosynthesis